MAPQNLVVVCCHGIWLGGPTEGEDESEWLIADFQAGETPTFVEHIRAGLQCLVDDPDAVLFFSGGPTRSESRLSEAQSYANLAAARAYFSLFSSHAALADRVYVESQALDSYHNILRSLILFWRLHSTWPAQLTIVSHAFKRGRLVDSHCTAIGFPADRVIFVGIDPPGMVRSAAGGAGDVAKPDAMRGSVRTADLWDTDPHGVGPILAGKRTRRNPWAVKQEFFETEEERTRSGLVTRWVEGAGEALDAVAPRPWM